MEKSSQKYPVFSMFLYFKNALINEIATSLRSSQWRGGWMGL